jgi:hypothetical protein
VTAGTISPLLINRRIVCRYTATLAIITSGALIISAQIQRDVDFADLIRTPSSIQRTLEHCDGHPDFETALANWLEMAEPSSRWDRQAVRETSLRLLEDTTDRQLVMGLSDGLLRHALEDIKREPAIVAEELARALYADIGKAVKKQKSKATAVLVPAYGLGKDGTVTNERQARFLKDFLNLADPRVAHRVQPPSQHRLGNPAGNTGLAPLDAQEDDCITIYLSYQERKIRQGDKSIATEDIEARVPNRSELRKRRGRVGTR